MDLRVPQETQDRKVPQAIVECLVSQDQVDSRELEVSEVPRVSRVNQENLATMDHRVYQEWPARRDLQDHRVIRVSKDRLVSLVLQELPDALETRAQLVRLVRRDFRELQVCLVLRDRRVRLDRLANEDCEVKLDHRVSMGRQVREVNLAHQVWKVPKAMPERLGRRVSRVIVV